MKEELICKSENVMLPCFARYISASDVKVKFLAKAHFMGAPCSCEPAGRTNVMEEVAEDRIDGL
jgi:hypothetical protein